MNKLAILFPGQGSQQVGMLAQVAAQYPTCATVFAEASDVLGYDLWELTQQGPAEKLNQTQFTQPAMLVADVALFRVWQEIASEQPQFMAGHSLGEYAAYVCAGAVTLADAVAIVAQRARLMQAAVPQGEGSMAAIIGLEDQQVREICQQAAAGEIVEPANYNALGQVVIAGHSGAVERAIALALEHDARLATVIPVSVSCHCQLLKPAAAEFAEHLAQLPITTPQVPVISNAEVAILTEPAAIRASLTKQLYQPVQWVKTIQLCAAEGVTTALECGPGAVLSGLVKRICREIKVEKIGSIIDEHRT